MKRGRKFKMSMEEMKQMIDEFRKSGKTEIEFAKEKGLQKIQLVRYMAVVTESETIPENPSPVNA